MMLILGFIRMLLLTVRIKLEPVRMVLLAIRMLLGARRMILLTVRMMLYRDDTADH